MKVDGYVRVSQVDGRRGPSFISPQVQREEIEKWAAFKKAELLAVHVDLDQSGGLLERPGLQLALERIEAGISEGIVVAKLDRFSRSLTGALETIRRLDAAGGAFVSVAEGLDPTTPAGKMMLRLMLVMAEFELDRMREGWEESRRRAIGRGVHMAGRAPVGYLRSAEGPLVPDPELAGRIATCFRMRAERRSWVEVTRYAEESGEGRPGEPLWTYDSLSRRLRNRVYVGEVRSGAYRLPGAHQPLVERGIFELAQFARSATAQSSDNRLVLAGLLRCAGCGKSLGTTLVRRRDGETRPRYACRGRSAAGLCPQPVSFRGTEIEQLVESAFFDLYRSSPLRRTASVAARRKAEDDLELAEAALARFDGRHPGRSTEDGERSLLLGRLELARTRAADLARSTLLESPARLRARWPRLPVGERRRIIGLMMDAVLMRDDRRRGLADRLLVIPFGLTGEGLPQPMRPSARVPYEWSRTAACGPLAVLAPGDPSPSFC